jgi:hypothetical protein
MGTWGVVSPRTCPQCTIRMTVWWAIAIEKKDINALTSHQRKVIGRILKEVPVDTSDEQEIPS